MTTDSYEIEVADGNAPRMSHMTDADIRSAIKSEARSLSGPMGYGVGIGAYDAEGEARVHVAELRTELRRRACAIYGLPMLTGVQMITLKHVAEGREQKPAYRPLFEELRALGLLADDDEYRITSVARVILDNASDVAVNLLTAVRATRQIDDVTALILRSVEASTRLDAMEAAE